RDQLHEIYRRWRAIADSYEEPRVLVGEIWLPDAERFARYLRPDELHTAFNFDFLGCPWEAGRMRASIDGALAAHAPVDAPATWVLSNHDVTRPVTRYGRADSSFAFESKRAGTPTDLARAARPWLDQPDDWAPLTVEAESSDPSSMLSLYRAGLRVRRQAPWAAGPFAWLPSGDEVLAFTRGEDFACLVNFGPEPVALPPGA